MIYVLIAITLASIGGITLLLGATTTRGAARVIADHAQARQIAETGLAIGSSYAERTPDWREARSPGVWIADYPVLGGRLTLSSEFEPLATPPIEVNDPSFEAQVATLPTPLLNPPMSGVIGGWSVQRTALVQTGLTVPRIGTRVSVDSTEGSNQAFISFGLSVTGTGTLFQTLGTDLAPNTFYYLAVDIDTEGLPPLDTSFGFRVFAGGTLVASTDEALDITDFLTPMLEDIQGTAEDLLENAQEPATLIRTLLGGSTSEYTLAFATDGTPPAGAVRLELFAESVGLASTVAFDHIRLDAVSNDPPLLTALGRKGEGSHAISAWMVRDLAGSYRVVVWEE